VTSIAIVFISISYSYLLHYIKDFDRSFVASMYSDSKGSIAPSRRESIMPRRESLRPPTPGQAGYSAIESPGSAGIEV
jgi:hypothetical protein